MRNLKLLNNFSFLILVLLACLFFESTFSNEPEDIWNLDKSSNSQSKTQSSVTEEIEGNSIYEMQKINNEENFNKITEDNELSKEEINLTGIYDPSDNDLYIDMWSYSDGNEILFLMDKIDKINLSKDSEEILEILLLTSSYLPKKNISSKQFLAFKENWLIHKSDLDLIKLYLEKNENLENKDNLLKFYVDKYLSIGKISEACDIFNQKSNLPKNNYLLKFKIYCFINDEKIEEANLNFDFLKENGFEDTFFENSFFHMMGYENKIDNLVSEKTLLDFHLSHLINPNFDFEPTDDTSKEIWKYLSSFNLLTKIDNVDLENQEKIETIEKATSEKNYLEEDLFNLYERFLFNINQLLTIKESSKVLPNFQARALIYQGILISKSSKEKLELIQILKKKFDEDDISEAFDQKLDEFLNTINEEEIPLNYLTFYNDNLKNKNQKIKKIRFNNKVFHQSKLLSYFIEKNYNKKIVQKDLEVMLKKLKKDKKYFFSIKDKILLETLKFEGFDVPKKYEDIYGSLDVEIPDDIQVFIDNNEIGMVLLRLVEVIGEDAIHDIGPETIHFIVNVLNQINTSQIRNKILLKVLPLKV